MDCWLSMMSTGVLVYVVGTHCDDEFLEEGKEIKKEDGVEMEKRWLIVTRGVTDGLRIFSA